MCIRDSDTEVENEDESDPYESAREIDSLAKTPSREANETGEAFSKAKESSSDIASPFENIFDEAGGARVDAEDGEKSRAEQKTGDASALISEEEFTALTARDDAPLGEIEELSWPDFPEENVDASYLKSDEDIDESGKEKRKTVPFWERERPRKAEDMISSKDEDDFLQDSDESGDSDAESVFGDISETDESINSSDELLHGESLDPDFFDVDLNEASTASGNETPRDFAGNVFNDMDADVLSLIHI